MERRRGSGYVFVSWYAECLGFVLAVFVLRDPYASTRHAR